MSVDVWIRICQNASLWNCRAKKNQKDKTEPGTLGNKEKNLSNRVFIIIHPNKAFKMVSVTGKHPLFAIYALCKNDRPSQQIRSLWETLIWISPFYQNDDFSQIFQCNVRHEVNKFQVNCLWFSAQQLKTVVRNELLLMPPNQVQVNDLGPMFFTTNYWVL